jgi:hypothetical protein
MVKVAAKTDEPCSDLKQNENGTINDCQQHESEHLIESIKPLNNHDQTVKDDSLNDSYNVISMNSYEKKLEKQIRASYQQAAEDNMNGKFCIPYFTTAGNC